MGELCLMASSTYAPGLFHHEQGLCRSPKEVLSIVPSTGRKQEMIRSGLLHTMSPLVGDPFKPNGWLFSDQGARLESTTRKPVIVDVQDTRSNSILFSFGISEHCTRHKKILQYLMSGSSVVETDGIDYSLLSSLTGIPTNRIQMRLGSLVPRDGGASLYEVGADESHSSIIYPSDYYAQRMLMDPLADLAHFSKATIHPDGRVLFTGTDLDMKDIMSVFAECDMLKNSVKQRKQQVLVPHFTRLDTNESHVNVRGSSLKAATVTFTPLKSPAKIKIKPPSPRKRNTRRVGREEDVSRRSSLHACESLLSVILDKKRGKAAILSLKKSGSELPHLLTQFSAGIAGTGLAVIFFVACNVLSGRTPVVNALPTALLNTGFGSAMVWLSWAVNKLRDTIVHITRSSSKAASFSDKEMMKKVDASVNEIFFRVVTVMAVAVLRFA